MTRHTTFVRLATFALLVCVAAPVAWGTERLELGFDVELRDAYVWRGQVLTDGAVAQPALSAALGNFSAGIWGNLVLDASSGETGQFSEVDVVVAYARATKTVGMEVGLTSYAFPNAEIGSTSELHVAAELLGLPVSTGLSVHYDLDEADGFYATASIGKQFDVHRALDLGVGLTSSWASSGYNAFYFGLDDSRVGDGSLFVDGSFTVGGDIGLRLGVQYSWLWDSEIETGARSLYADDAHVGFVFGMSHAF